MKVILFLLLLPCVLWAQPQQSTDFRITKSVIDGGGLLSASQDFRLTSAFGQPSPLRTSSSSDFVLYSGFLSPVLMVSPLSPIQDLVIHYAAPDAILHWGRQPSALSYKIYRDTDPLFVSGTGNYLGAASDTLFMDVNALELPEVRYYYNVTASSDPVPTLLAKNSVILTKAIPRKTDALHPNH
jgi:hypothetical protein